MAARLGVWTLLKFQRFYPNIKCLYSSLKGLHFHPIWIRLKKLHCNSFNTHFSQTRTLSLRIAMLLTTGGLFRGFLGFKFGKKEEKKEEDPLLRAFKEAKTAQIKRDFKTAEVQFHEALKVADDMLKMKKIDKRIYIYAKINIYDSLANIALAQGELEKAEILYKETLKGCLQQGVPEDDNSIVELSMKLASIYAMQERNPEAEQGLQFCINTQDSKMAAYKTKQVSLKASEGASKRASTSDKAPATDGNVIDQASSEAFNEAELKKDTEALLGMSLETYGRFLMGQHRLTEAVSVLERACLVAENVLGQEAEQYLILINDLATAHIFLKHFDVAASLLNKAISTARKIESPELPMLYCNLGAVFLRTSKMDDAQAACVKGRDLASKNKHSVALTMSQKCLDKINQLKKKA